MGNNFFNTRIKEKYYLYTIEIELYFFLNIYRLKDKQEY